jgi:ATP-dependent DNA helicase RecG
MKTAEQLIEELNTLDESVSIEAKTSRELGTSFLDTACAFANEPDLGGGYILLGVAPVSDSFWPIYEPIGL